MKRRIILIGAAALIAAVGVVWAIADATFVIDEMHQVIITQFGDPIGPAITTPGLHYKLPFVQNANFFERRMLEYEGNPSEIPTKDKFFIRVATFARWRISDPLKFFQRVRDEAGALPRIDEILDGETRNAVSRYDLVEVVRTTNRPPGSVTVQSDEDNAILTPIELGREKIAQEILRRAAARTSDLGVELLDVRFKRINYAPQIESAIFARMIAERRRMAELYRSEGDGEFARISGELERELKRIQSEAYRDAQMKRGDADAVATKIYGDAYGRDPSFYSFTKSLETYEQTMDGGTTLILGTDSSFLKHLKR